MYFDRPCVLSGTLHIGEKSYRHDITIPVAGFHLLRVQQQDARHYTLVRADATSAITFSIHLLNLQQT
jgi:hypothetical protein